MTSQPQRGVQNPRNQQSNSGPKTGKFWLLMFVGGGACLWGVYLMLLSYSSHPTKFNVGVALAAVGGIAGLVGAIRLTIIRRR